MARGGAPQSGVLVKDIGAASGGGILVSPNDQILPCVVVRKEQKGYGVTGRIAGTEVAKGEHVLFFDDVISEGLSKLEAIKPLEKLGAHVDNILVVVDREQHGKENLAKLGYRVHALTRVTDLARELLQGSKIPQAQADAVFNYVKNARCTS